LTARRFAARFRFVLRLPQLRRLYSGLLFVVLAAPLASLADHDNTLHDLRLAQVAESASGCSAQHPPSFEPKLEPSRASCPGCLSQAQQRTVNEKVAPLPALLATAEDPPSSARISCRQVALRPAASRGPPIA
jgi:hypothetical protein